MVWVMEDQFYLSTGKAAQELGASQDTIRALCNGGAIRAVPTNGRQWRIPAREIERLKREGLPPVPRPMPGDGPAAKNANRLGGHDDDGRDPRRAASRLPEVVQAWGAVDRKKAEREGLEEDLNLRKIRKQLKLEDDAELAAQRRATEEARRTDEIRQWEQDALTVFDQEAPDADPELRLEFHQAVRNRLAQLNPIPSRQVTAGLIRDVKGQYLRRHTNQQEILRMALDAMKALPFEARAKAWDKERSAWEIKLGDAIKASRPEDEDPPETNRRKINQALAEVTRQFEAHQADTKADNADAELRRSAIEELTRSLRGRLSDDDWANMQEAIEARFGQLARGTRRSKLDAACREAMAPWTQAVDQSDAEQRRLENEARQKRDADEAVRRDRQMREDLLSYPWLSLPWSFTQQEKDQTIAAARKTMDKLAHGASRAQLEQARDAIVVPAVQAHERRKAAESRIDRLLLDAIESAVAKEEKDGLELDGPVDRANFKFEIRDAIRGPLSDWLSPINGLKDDQLRHEIERRARRCVRESVPEQ